jgi:hypothetical protein
MDKHHNAPGEQVRSNIEIDTIKLEMSLKVCCRDTVDMLVCSKWPIEPCDQY